MSISQTRFDIYHYTFVISTSTEQESATRVNLKLIRQALFCIDSFIMAAFPGLQMMLEDPGYVFEAHGFECNWALEHNNLSIVVHFKSD